MENNQNKCLLCGNGNCQHHNGKFYLKKIVLIVILALAFGAIINQAVKTYGNYANPQTITITGIGEVMSKPDISTINFTLRESSKTNDTQLLQANISKSAEQVIQKLKAIGIEEKDIQTSNYSVNPKYNYSDGKSEVVGYEASESLNVKVRNTENVSKVLNILAEEKITEVYGPNFEVDDIQKVKDQARDIAIKDAKGKANNLAKALEVKIKRIVSYSDDSASNPGYPTPYREAKFMSASSDTSAQANLPTGEEKVTVNVSLTFQIED